MTTLLRIEASARMTRSLSRALSNDFFRNMAVRTPNDQVIIVT